MKKPTKEDRTRMTIFAELDTLKPAARRRVVELIVQWFNDK